MLKWHNSQWPQYHLQFIYSVNESKYFYVIYKFFDIIFTDYVIIIARKTIFKESEHVVHILWKTCQVAFRKSFHQTQPAKSLGIEDYQK